MAKPSKRRQFLPKGNYIKSLVTIIKKTSGLAAMNFKVIEHRIPELQMAETVVFSSCC